MVMLASTVSSCGFDTCVNHLYQVVQNEEWKDNSEENWRRVADDDENGEHA